MNDIVADLVVVGAGTAGIPCAIAAAELGVRVVVVEKGSEIGGTLHVSGGYMSAAGTLRQRELGIADSPETHFEDVMRNGRGTAHPDILRLVVNEAPNTVDWLQRIGFPFVDGVGAAPGGHGASDLGELQDGAAPPPIVKAKPDHRARRLSRMYVGPEMGRSILGTLLPIWNDLVHDGTIVLLSEHALVDFLFDDGVVAGVVAEGPRGAQTVHASAVVLATGGYASNPELFGELEPHTPRLVAVSRRNSRGDGLVAARRIGGAVRSWSAFRPADGVDDEDEARSDRDRPGLARLNAEERVPREIHVNLYGKRFRPEDDTDMDELELLLLRQPYHQMWIVFDEAALAAGDSFHTNWDESEVRRRAAEGKTAWKGDSLDELAARAGIDAGGLAATVAEWNRAVAGGVDPLGRTQLDYPVATPPFYAALTFATFGPTMGGLAVDGKLRVVDEGGAPIEGLYAVGEIIGSGATMGYRKTSGMMVTSALTLGRTLGVRLGAVLAGTPARVGI